MDLWKWQTSAFSYYLEFLRLIHVDLFLNETVKESRFHIHLPYFIVIPYCYGKHNPYGLSHGYGRNSFLKIDPRSLSISFCHKLGLEGCHLPNSSNLTFIDLLTPNGSNTLRLVH
ncbi:UNVERIFIED_CONTAM: hypothetical protein Sradi_6146400 [Sesamum radiatum]|uniref:Maturase K n=1 Tax=Sesamum radiatum TaxID=300843 RepID=A0AAW2KKD4_SESRA